MPPLWQPGWTASLFYSMCLYTRDLVSGGIRGPSGRPRGLSQDGTEWGERKGLILP